MVDTKIFHKISETCHRATFLSPLPEIEKLNFSGSELFRLLTYSSNFTDAKYQLQVLVLLCILSVILYQRHYFITSLYLSSLSMLFHKQYFG